MYNEGLIDFIKKYEGYRPKAYDDVGKPAIGYGSRFYFDKGDSKEYAVKMGDRIDEERAHNLLISALDRFTSQIKMYFPTFDSFPAGLKDAMLDTAYNQGVGSMVRNKQFVKSIRDAAADNVFSSIELNNIALTIKPFSGDNANLIDRKRRRQMMIVGKYNFQLDNNSIGTAKNNAVPELHSENIIPSYSDFDETGTISFNDYLRLFGVDTQPTSEDQVSVEPGIIGNIKPYRSTDYINMLS